MPSGGERLYSANSQQQGIKFQFIEPQPCHSEGAPATAGIRNSPFRMRIATTSVRTGLAMTRGRKQLDKPEFGEVKSLLQRLQQAFWYVWEITR